MSYDAHTIRARQLGKCYRIYDKPQDRLKQALWRGRRQYYQEFWALQDVSFTIERGETVGVIGRNGSGKSTLLQLIAGTLTPTVGLCDVNGRVAALLELGAGFNPDFTGRENVYMNAAILGFSTVETDARYADIVSFAEIGEFIDQPVKTYSTGMYLRLAFAVAVSVDPDILLVDEALAVGDVRFQAKCLERMRTIQQRGATIVFVSHSLEQVKRFCHRCVWLDGGRLVMDGEAAWVTDRYLDHMTVRTDDGTVTGSASALFPGQGALARICAVELSSDTLRTQDSLQVTITYEILERELTPFLLGVALLTANRNYIFGPNTALDGVTIPSTVGRHSVVYSIPRVPLLGGTYMIDVALFLDRGLVCLDAQLEAARFVVHAPYVTEGLVHIEHSWEVCE
jgi:ABC-type polysaccharide/polyol phosphate transport system ATPase subunit